VHVQNVREYVRESSGNTKCRHTDTPAPARPDFHVFTHGYGGPGVEYIFTDFSSVDSSSCFTLKHEHRHTYRQTKLITLSTPQLLQAARVGNER